MKGFDPGKTYDKPSTLTPEGEQLVLVKRCESRQSRSGNDMLDTTLELVDRSAPGAGGTLRCFYMLTDDRKAMYWLSVFCRAADPRMRKPGSGFDPLDQASVSEFLVGGCLAVTVYHVDDEYNGRTFKAAKVRKGSERPLTGAEEKLLREQHGGQLPGAADTFDDVDIPF